VGKRLTNEDVQNRISETFKQNVILVGDYINKRTPIKLKCLDCEYEWSTKASNILYTRENYSHYCPKCYTKKQKFSCAYCGKDVYRTPSDVQNNKSGHFYCSMECSNHHKNQIRKENGEWDNSKNYRLKAFDTYEHKCFVCGWNEDSRILEVHHKDSNRENNDIENLCILCPICHRKITLNYYDLVGNTLIKK
jgi:hypothetical protein